MHENRETSVARAGNNSRTAGEVLGRTTRVHASEESDSGIVPMNHSNKIEQSMAESEEGRPLIKENIHAPDTERSTRVTRAGGCAESEFLIASPPIIRDKSRMR